MVVLPVPLVALLEPVALCELVPEVELGALVLIGWPVAVPEVELVGLAAAGAPSDPVPVALVGAVLDGVEVGVPVDDTGAVGSVVGVPDVPSVIVGEVEAGGTGVDVGLVGSVRLSGFPGPYREIRWSGSSRSVSGSGADLAPDRAWRWLVRVEDGVGVSGLTAELVVGVAELATGVAELSSTLALGADAVDALRPLGRGLRVGTGVAA